MWKTIKDLLASKKAMMAFISALVWVVGKAGFNVDTEIMLGAVSPLWGYIFGQGIADHGKSKAEVEAGSNPQPVDGPVEEVPKGE